MINILLTGHSSGIGKSIINSLNTQDVNITGMSRTNGYDLKGNYTYVKDEIIKYNPNIFINNAYVPINQTNLLSDLWEK
jgi:nucleoside-diphosphate-sugar epimerase